MSRAREGNSKHERVVHISYTLSRDTTKKTKTFLFDFTVFRGNSGGPVYLYERAPLYSGSMHVGAIQGIVGVVTSERNISQRVEQLYERRETVTPLALAEVIHASFIEELIKPTVCPSVASRNLLLYQSLPISIPY